MHYTQFGRTGMQVSRLCLGCMSYGEPDRGAHGWSLTEAESRPHIRRAIESGINFFDTANGYSAGSSEEIMGRALKDFAYRDEIVVATKAYFPWRRAPNTAGLSRKALIQSLDDSLKRLDMDYVDLLQIHRWDYNTPIEETLEALTDLVKSGKVRYIGASSMFAWQFMKSLAVSERKGFSAFASMQNYYNLLYREEEREMLPLCEAEGIAVIPWSPMARGMLTRDWDEETARTKTDAVMPRLYEKTAEADRKVVEAVAQVSNARGVPRAQIALAWVLKNKVVTAPIIGATKAQHLDDAVAALDLELESDEIKILEAAYIPHAHVGDAQRMPVLGPVRLKDSPTNGAGDTNQ